MKVGTFYDAATALIAALIDNVSRLVEILERATGLTGDELDAFVSWQSQQGAVSDKRDLFEEVAAWRRIAPDEES